MIPSAQLPDLRAAYPAHGPAAETSADPKEPATLLGLVPGIALLFVVGYAGKFVEQCIARYGKAHHYVLPNIEYVLWAVLFGVLVANTVGLPRIFRAGVATYEFWLKADIILLGARFILGDILKLGGIFARPRRDRLHSLHPLHDLSWPRPPTQPQADHAAGSRLLGMRRLRHHRHVGRHRRR